MRKITDLTEKRFRTTYVKDNDGTRKKVREEVTGKRPIKTVESGPRFGHFIIDLIFFQIVIYFIDYLFQLLISLTSTSVSISLTFVLISNIMLLLLYPFLYFFCELKWQKKPQESF